MSAERSPVTPAKLRLPATPYLTYLRRVHIYRRLPPPPSHGTRRRGLGVMSRVSRRGRCGGVLAGLVLLGGPTEQPELLCVLLVAHAVDLTKPRGPRMSGNQWSSEVISGHHLTKLSELQPVLLAHHAAREHSVEHRGVPVVVSGREIARGARAVSVARPSREDGAHTDRACDGAVAGVCWAGQRR